MTVQSFASRTQVKLLDRSISRNTLAYHFSLRFPNGMSGDLALTMQVDATLAPTADERNQYDPAARAYILSYSHEASQDGAQTTAALKYFIPYSSLPSEGVRKLRALVKQPVGSADRRRTAPRLLNAVYLYAADRNAPSEIEPGTSGVMFSWLSDVSGQLGAVNAFLQSIVLNAKDAELLNTLKAFKECAEGKDRSEASKIYQDAVNAVAGQYSMIAGALGAGLLIGDGLGEVAATGLAGFLGDEVFARVLENCLAQMRKLLDSYCQGTWWGTYHISVRTIGGDFGSHVNGTTDYSGNLVFKSNAAPRSERAMLLKLGVPTMGINGTATGHFMMHLTRTYTKAHYQDTTEGEGDYTADVAGTDARNETQAFHAPADAVVGRFRTTSTYVERIRDGCTHDSGNVKTFVPIGETFLWVKLVDNYTTEGGYGSPGGDSWRFTVTVHRLP